MTLGPVIDESRFQAGFDAGDFAFIYVGFFLSPRWYLDIKVVELLAVHQGHTQLFGLRGVDEHSFHVLCLSRARP